MSHHTLLIATSNPGKFKEIAEILEDVPFELFSLKDVGLKGDAPEEGNTFRENALSKANYYAEQSGLLTLAEDSGILVDTLKGALGVKTRRWGKGEKASDQEWVEHFLETMKKVPAQKRTASFVCCGALVVPEKIGPWKVPASFLKKFKQRKPPFIFEGRTEGFITTQLEAPVQKGLALSSCFKPVGFEKVYAALNPEEKHRISHRGKALQPFRELLFVLRDFLG